MNIDVFTLCWNEEKMLPYFLRHYSSFARSITVFDNLSDDRSVEIIESCPLAKVIPYDTGGEVRDDMYLEIKNTCWQESDADYVIVVDMDELLWHEDLLGFLSKNSQYSFFRPVGWDMVSQKFPTTGGQIYDEVVRGIRYPIFCKPCLFSPQRIEEINFAPGCHDALPTGDVKELRDQEELKLLHFKYLELNYVVQRYRSLNERLSTINANKGWGVHYSWSLRKIREKHQDNWQQSEMVFK